MSVFVFDSARGGCTSRRRGREVGHGVRVPSGRRRGEDGREAMVICDVCIENVE